MRTSVKLLMLAIIAALTLSSLAQIASANRALTIESAGAIRATARSLTFSESEGAITAEITLEGSLHRGATPKVERVLSGFVLTVNTANCRAIFFACTVRVLNLPWHMRYVSFRGTLPNITGIRLEMTGVFLLEIPIARKRCLYFGTIQADTSNPVTRLVVLPNTASLVTDLNGGSRCEATGEFSGAFNVTPTQTLRLS